MYEIQTEYLDTCIEQAYDTENGAAEQDDHQLDAERWWDHQWCRIQIYWTKKQFEINHKLRIYAFFSISATKAGHSSESNK